MLTTILLLVCFVLFARWPFFGFLAACAAAYTAQWEWAGDGAWMERLGVLGLLSALLVAAFA